MSRNLRTLDQLPPRHREEALRQLASEDAKKFGVAVSGEPDPMTKPAGVAMRAPPHPAISTDEAKLNKTEREFLAYLRSCTPLWIGIQNVTLKLADDCRYTCDFLAMWEEGLEFFEVKGFWRDDARVKIKVAARMFPWARFTAVQRVKGAWKFEEINP
jgi:hypothetical protein